MNNALRFARASAAPVQDDNVVAMPLASRGCLVVMPIADEEEARAWDEVVMAKAA